MGISGATGVIIGTLIIVPLQFLVGKLMSENNKRIFGAQDVRLYKSTETLQGMKTVKLGCLEDALLDKINDARNKELRFLRRDSFFWSVMAFLASVSTIIVSTVTIGLYVALEDQNFSAANIFSALALLGQLTVCLSVFPVTIPIFIKGLVSRERLLEFFARTEVSIYKENSLRKLEDSPSSEDYEVDEQDDDNEEGVVFGDDASAQRKRMMPEVEEEEEEEEPAVEQEESSVGILMASSPLTALATCSGADANKRIRFPEYAFTITDGTFSWPKTNTCVLRNINIKIKTGTLTIVIGSSGSGKTALISALTEEMERVSGKVSWNLPSPVALTGQKPWLLNASIKDNILLGRPLKEKRYRKVLTACDLNADIDLLPEGDETEVGERGVLLSGGQRQRLAIARCIYSKAACTFLDAPFSALDANITSHIFSHGIMSILLKRKRTVFMATERIDFLSKADHVIYMKDGYIRSQGSVDEVMRANPELRVNMKDMLSRSSSLAEGGGLAAEGRTAQERWKLLKNVTKCSIIMRQTQRHHGASRLSGKEAKPSLRQHQVVNHSCSLKKRTSSNKLVRSQLRMDSSSQLNLCHDILLPSDECPDNNSVFHGSSSKQHRPIGNSINNNNNNNRRGGRHKSISNGARQKTFSRASSWSASLTNSVNLAALTNRASITSTSSATPSNGGGGNNTIAARRSLAGGGGGGQGSTGGLIRQMAITNSSAAAAAAAAAAAGGGSGGPPSATSSLTNRRQSSHNGEFQRIRSFHHVLAFKQRHLSHSGSHASIPKHSNSEPDGFSFESNNLPYFPSRSTSRQSSYQESGYSSSGAGGGAGGGSIVGAHSRVVRMTSNASAISGISGFSDDFHDDDGEDDGLILSRESSNPERREYGEIGVNVYAEYFKAGGLHFSVLFVLLSVGLQGIKVYMDFLLRDWSLESQDADDSISLGYFTTYSSLSVAVLFFSCLANLIGQLIGARARRKLHEQMLTNLLR